MIYLGSHIDLASLTPLPLVATNAAVCSKKTCRTCGRAWENSWKPENQQANSNAAKESYEGECGRCLSLLCPFHNMWRGQDVVRSPGLKIKMARRTDIPASFELHAEIKPQCLGFFFPSDTAQRLVIKPVWSQNQSWWNKTQNGIKNY